MRRQRRLEGIVSSFLRMSTLGMTLLLLCLSGIHGNLKIDQVNSTTSSSSLFSPQLPPSLFSPQLPPSSSPFLPPILKKKRHQVAFGKVKGEYRGLNPMDPPIYRKDPYFWVRNDTQPTQEIWEHVAKENAYTNHMMHHLKDTIDELAREIDPFKNDGDVASNSYSEQIGSYLYIIEKKPGHKYSCHYRKHMDTLKVELLLDENEYAKGSYLSVDADIPSDEFEYFVYIVDNTGKELKSMYIMYWNEKKEKQLDVIHNMCQRPEWEENLSTIYYLTVDEVYRSNKVWKHILGTSQSEDECLFTELNPLYGLNIMKSWSSQYLFILSENYETSVWRYLDLKNKNPNGIQLIQKPQEGLMYRVCHQGNHFYILNIQDKGTQQKIFRCPVASIDGGLDDCIEVVTSTKFYNYFDTLHCFRNYLVLEGGQNESRKLWVYKNTNSLSKNHLTTSKSKNETSSLIMINSTSEYAVYQLELESNNSYDSLTFDYSCSSEVVPNKYYTYNVTSGKSLLQNRLSAKTTTTTTTEMYEPKRLYAMAEDGTMIPISIFYRRDKIQLNQPHPMYLLVYGSYGLIHPFKFRTTYIPMLDRGMIYAVAHVRGGGDLGPSWYNQAKLLNKTLSITDFIQCVEHLIKIGLTTPSMLAIGAGSAGGLVLGAALNRRPDLFRVAVAVNPFVDILNTMCDPKISLTIAEWSELGNPNQKQFYDYMATYSPVDNVKYQNYPSILVTGGINDARVPYWEPMKWIAKLREFNTNNNTMLLRMELGGHFGGASENTETDEFIAFRTAFVLDQLGLLQQNQVAKNSGLPTHTTNKA